MYLHAEFFIRLLVRYPYRNFALRPFLPVSVPGFAASVSRTFIANMLFGGLGLLDMFGGCIVGIVTTAIIVLIRRQGWSRWLM